MKCRVHLVQCISQGLNQRGVKLKPTLSSQKIDVLYIQGDGPNNDPQSMDYPNGLPLKSGQLLVFPNPMPNHFLGV